LLALRRSFRALRRPLLISVAELVKSDIDDIGLELGGWRDREGEAFLDIDELQVHLFRRHHHRNPLELGHDGPGFRTLAHDRVAHGNVELARTAHRTENDASLNPDLDGHRAALHHALAGCLAKRELITQVAGGGLIGLGGDIECRRAAANVHAGALHLRRRWRRRGRLFYPRLRTGEEAHHSVAERGRFIGRHSTGDGGAACQGRRPQQQPHQRTAATVPSLLVMPRTH
jgi:hypothetical protein